jgi:hypothetical protein
MTAGVLWRSLAFTGGAMLSLYAGGAMAQQTAAVPP